jgi:3-dehydroquinate synthase
MKPIGIKSVSGNYNVYFSNDFEKILKDKDFKNSHLLIDRNIWNLYKNKIGNKFISTRIIIAKEANKSLEEVIKYIKFLLKNNIHKNQSITVIGGALIQDIGSFTAHILLRGINWIFVPTTILAMADSCIGSKSGINVGKYKNQVGSFHPPVAIYICPEFIKTLPESEIVNGIGEILKHGLIKGGKAFKEISKRVGNIRNLKNAQRIIYESLLIKKRIIEEDELEKNIRKILNYGHTFGHAIEGYTDNSISHGSAVIIGMDMANYISFKRGILTQQKYLQMNRILKKYFPDKFKLENIPLYMKFLKRDKKATDEGVSAILSRGIGKIEIIKIKFDKELEKTISEYIKNI